MFDVPVLLAFIVLLALAFDFTNGAHDCANAIASAVSRMESSLMWLRSVFQLDQPIIGGAGT